MHPHAGRRGQRIAQLKERDIRVLGDQLFKESLMRCELSFPARRSLGGRFRMALCPDLMRPPCPCRW